MKIPKNLGETAADIVTGSRIRRHLKLPNFRTAFRRHNAFLFYLQAVLTLITAGINLLLPVSEGGMNLKTTDINQLINTMGIKAMSEKKQLKRLFQSPERRNYVPA